MLVHFIAIWFILLPFGIVCGLLVDFMNIFPFVVCCTKKNLATLTGIVAKKMVVAGVVPFGGMKEHKKYKCGIMRVVCRFKSVFFLQNCHFLPALIYLRKITKS
jgi:hypothetical protein